MIFSQLICVVFAVGASRQPRCVGKRSKLTCASIPSKICDFCLIKYAMAFIAHWLQYAYFGCYTGRLMAILNNICAHLIHHRMNKRQMYDVCLCAQRSRQTFVVTFFFI